MSRYCGLKKCHVTVAWKNVTFVWLENNVTFVWSEKNFAENCVTFVWPENNVTFVWSEKKVFLKIMSRLCDLKMMSRFLKMMSRFLKIMSRFPKMMSRFSFEFWCHVFSSKTSPRGRGEGTAMDMVLRIGFQTIKVKNDKLSSFKIKFKIPLP